MQLVYTLTLSDVRAALRLHSKQNWGRRVRFIISSAIVPALAVVVSISWILLGLIGHTEWVSMLRNFGIVLIFLSFFSYFYRVELARRVYKQIFPRAVADRASNVDYIDIDSECIFSRTPGVGEHRYFWTSIVAFAQNDRMTLLYVDEGRFLLFPTRALSSEQGTELNDLVARHVPKGKR